MRYGIDNGAWSAYQKGTPFDAALFRGLLEGLGAGADWIVVPDVVAGGLDSLRFSESWFDELERFSPIKLLPVQDGMTPADVAPLLGPRRGIFVGGSTEWKESTMEQWGELARARGCHLHVGRVNSIRRIRLCALAGADSFDGTSVTRYAVTIGRLDQARKQRALIFGD